MHACMVFIPLQILPLTDLLTNIKIYLITARKRSLRRLCFYTCLSFCSQGGEYLGRYPPGQVHPQTGTPRQVHPPGRYTPQAGTPPRQVHPPGRYPSAPTVHAGIRSTSGPYASHWNAFLLFLYQTKRMFDVLVVAFS